MKAAAALITQDVEHKVALALREEEGKAELAAKESAHALALAAKDEDHAAALAEQALSGRQWSAAMPAFDEALRLADQERGIGENRVLTPRPGARSVARTLRAGR